MWTQVKVSIFLTNFSLFLFTLLIFWNVSETESMTDELKQILTPEEIVRLEMEQFEREVEDFTRTMNEENRRKKRTVIFNTLTPIDLGLIVGIPIIVILPTLTNFFNWKWKRSVDEIEADESELIPEEDPIVQPDLDRISTYFEMIQIPEKSCQRRAVCEFSADPEKFYPVSELVLNRIRNPSLPVLAYLEDNTVNDTNSGKSLFKLYSEAADKGLSYGSPICAQEFRARCPHSTEKRLNMPVLGFWNLLSSALSFTMTDDIYIQS